MLPVLFGWRVSRKVQRSRQVPSSCRAEHGARVPVLSGGCSASGHGRGRWRAEQTQAARTDPSTLSHLGGCLFPSILASRHTGDPAVPTMAEWGGLCLPRTVEWPLTSLEKIQQEVCVPCHTSKRWPSSFVL